jgi:hypothetical protein
LARLGLNLITKCGMFPDGCLEPAANKTWASFNQHFILQDHNRQETATTASAVYSGAVQPVVPPIINEASFPATSIAALAATVRLSGAELVALLTELAKLRAAAKASTSAKPASRGYYWTQHGITTNSAHSSAMCRNKVPGHIDTAAWRNKQGGNK